MQEKMREKLLSMYKEICSQMVMLLDSLDNKGFYIKFHSRIVIYKSFRLYGYTECLHDLGILSDDNFKKFSNFTKQVRQDVKKVLNLYSDMR